MHDCGPTARKRRIPPRDCIRFVQSVCDDADPDADTDANTDADPDNYTLCDSSTLREHAHIEPDLGQNWRRGPDAPGLVGRPVDPPGCIGGGGGLAPIDPLRSQALSSYRRPLFERVSHTRSGV